VIRAIVGKAGRLPRGYSEIGDDVAAVPAGEGRLVVKVDMLVEGTDVPRGMSYRQAARKAVAMCVSDFAAKGVRPDSFLVSLGLRRRTTKTEVDELAYGFRDAEKEWGAVLVGGDTNEAKELVIDCAMLGFAERLVGRRGARAGDLLVTTGRFGLQPSGLRILSGKVRSSPGFRRRAVASVLSPRPSLEVGLALAPYLSSGMDSSDGLARCIHTLAAAGGVGFEANAVPASEGVRGFSRENGLDFDSLVWGGGEEYVVVGTLPKGRLEAASRSVKGAGGELLVIGRATGSRRIVLKGGSAARPIPDEGWTHLG
jgi:thiamine-monophosphate kinase